MALTQIGRYEIKSELGRGGMATVYLAFDPRFKRDVAIKVLPREFLHDPQFRVRFEREAQTIAMLDHPAIVTVFDYGEEEGLPFLVMRYMAGGSLADRLRQGHLPLSEAARIFVRLAPAIDEAHTHGVIHRDLKPGNILFDQRNDPYISDFGIVKLSESSFALTGSALIGTPAYMSPEQVRGEGSIDGRSDLYALGAILFETLTGKLPYEATTPMGMAFKHVNEPVPRLADKRANLPPVCQTIIERAMAKQREDRYASATEMAQALDTALASLAGAQRSTAPASEASAAPTRPEPKPARRVAIAAPPAALRDAVVTGQQPRAAPGKRPAPPAWVWVVSILGSLVCVGALAIGGIGALVSALGGQVGPAQVVGVTPTAPLLTTETPLTLVSDAPPTPIVNTAGLTPVPTTLLSCINPVNAADVPLPANPKTVTGGLYSEPDNIIPYFTTSGEAVSIAQLTNVGLAEWDKNGNLVPELAESWEVSADGLTITWRLRPCLYWSDGEPITAHDIKFTWESIMDSRNTQVDRSGYDQIANIDVSNDRTAVVRFKELYPAWPLLFAPGAGNSGGVILPAHLFPAGVALQNNPGYQTNPFVHQPDVSSGPFVITDWAAGDHLTLVANPNFYKGRPKLDRVIVKFIPETATALTALQAGEIDWYPFFSISDISALAALEPAVHLDTSTSTFMEHYLFNLGTTQGVGGQGKSDVNGFCPFQDVRVRRAIALAIDRQRIVDTLLLSETRVATTLWVDSYWMNTSLSPYPYDPEGARQLLDEAGYSPGADGIRVGNCRGQRTRLSFNFETTTRQIRQDMANMAQTDLKQIGVEFKPTFTEAAKFFATYKDDGPLYTGNYDMAGFAWAYFLDPDSDFMLCASVPSSANPEGSNFYRYCNPELDALFAQGNATADLAARKQVFDQIQQYIYDNVLMIPMYETPEVIGYADRFIPGPFSSLSGMNWNAETWDVR